MDDMSRLVLFIQTTRLLRISVNRKSLIIAKKGGLKEWQETDLRSPSEELANIHVSPGFFPYREPSGSELMM